jgi:hypothetical protein
MVSIIHPENIWMRNGGERQAIFIFVNLSKTNVGIHFLSGKADLDPYSDFSLPLKKHPIRQWTNRMITNVRVVTSMLWLVFQIHWPPEDKPAFIFKNFPRGIGICDVFLFLVEDTKER